MSVRFTIPTLPKITNSQIKFWLMKNLGPCQFYNCIDDVGIWGGEEWRLLVYDIHTDIIVPDEETKIALLLELC